MTGPIFLGNRELARFVDKENRLTGNRTAAAAFIEPTESNRAKEHLSVNSLELEGLAQIARFYQSLFQSGSGDVAICTTKVFDFSDAGRKAGVSLSFSRPNNTWEFVNRQGKSEEAYRYRPVSGRKDDLESPSHCGVEFVRAMDDYAKTKFARRLGGRRFHVVGLAKGLAKRR